MTRIASALTEEQIAAIRKAAENSVVWCRRVAL